MMGTWVQGAEQEMASLFLPQGAKKTGPLGLELLILNKTLLPFLVCKYNGLSYILQILENLHFIMKAFPSNAMWLG